MFDIQPTQESLAISDLQSMSSFSQQAIDEFIQYTEKAYNAFWYAHTPPQIKVSLLGTKALEIFTKHAQSQAFIKSINPSHVELGIPPEYIITWHEDGSATITESNVPIE